MYLPAQNSYSKPSSFGAEVRCPAFLVEVAGSKPQGWFRPNVFILMSRNKFKTCNVVFIVTVRMEHLFIMLYLRLGIYGVTGIRIGHDRRLANVPRSGVIN